MKEFIQERVFKYLCPPGNGVHTVHTAKANKDKLHQKLYQTVEPSMVLNKWQESFQHLNTNQQTCLFGVTLDTGGGIQRGANWGPLFIRSVLSSDQYFDLGDTKTIPHLLHDKYLNEETIKSCQKALYQTENNLPVSGLSIAEDFCDQFYRNFPEKKLISLGGDHSVSYALVKPWIKAKRESGKKVAIIHFDAHTDLMATRLGIDICFGSWAYHMIELLEKPSDLIQVGIRSSGEEKSFWESKLGVKQYWANETQQAPEKITKEINLYLRERNIDELYISFDIDALDASYASATGTPENGGMSLATSLQMITDIAKENSITGADLVEVAPFVRNTEFINKNPEPETTLASAKQIVEKFLKVMQ